jgi:hypothetical protein
MSARTSHGQSARITMSRLTLERGIHDGVKVSECVSRRLARSGTSASHTRPSSCLVRPKNSTGPAVTIPIWTAVCFLVGSSIGLVITLVVGNHAWAAYIIATRRLARKGCLPTTSSHSLATLTPDVSGSEGSTAQARHRPRQGRPADRGDRALPGLMEAGPLPILSSLLSR